MQENRFDGREFRGHFWDILFDTEEQISFAGKEKDVKADEPIRWETAKEENGEKISLHKKFSLRKWERTI